MDPEAEIAYDPERDAYRAHYDIRRRSPTLALVEAVATIEDSDPISLDPIGDSLDATAVDRILQSSNDGRITLTYQGYHATISTDGVVDLRPTDTAPTNPIAD